MEWRLAGGANRSGTDKKPAGQRVAWQSAHCKAALWPRKPATKSIIPAFSFMNLNKKNACRFYSAALHFELAQNLNALLMVNLVTGWLSQGPTVPLSGQPGATFTNDLFTSVYRCLFGVYM